MHLDTAPWGAACKAVRLLSAPNHRMAEKTWEQTQPWAWRRWAWR